MYKSRLQEQPHQSAKYTTTLLRSGASLTALTVSYRSSMKCTRALLSFTRGRCEMVPARHAVPLVFHVIAASHLTPRAAFQQEAESICYCQASSDIGALGCLAWMLPPSDLRPSGKQLPAGCISGAV